MKYVNLAVLALLLPFASSFAADTANASKHPCQEIVKACEGAGFVKGGHKDKKGLWKDCVGPIKSGQTVSGVSVDPGTVQACQAKKAAKKANSVTKSS
jgi:hypothetical protein